jgi:hypothetical protein
MIGRARGISIVAEVGVRGAAGTPPPGLAGLRARERVRVMGSQNYYGWPYELNAGKRSRATAQSRPVKYFCLRRTRRRAHDRVS